MSDTHPRIDRTHSQDLWSILSQLMEENAPSWQLFQWSLPESLLHEMALVLTQEIFTAEEEAQRPIRLEWYRVLLTKKRWLKQEASDTHLSSAWYKAKHSFRRPEARKLEPVERIVWRMARSVGDRNGRRSARVVSELWMLYRLMRVEPVTYFDVCHVKSRLWRHQYAESIQGFLDEQNELLLKLARPWL